jgi:hypothetical protein
MPTTFGINGSTISPTPSEIKVTPPRHKLHEGADGTSTVSKRTKGHVVEVTWGSAAAYTAAMAAIRTALGSNAEATLTWTDPTGTTTTAMTFVHQGLPAYVITANEHYGKITHTFYET